MAASQAAKHRGDEWGLTWYLRWGIYTSIPTWTHSQNSLAAAEALSLKISSHGTSLKWSQIWVYGKVIENWDNNMIRILQWKESHRRTNTSIRRKKEIQKSRTMRITVWDPSRKVNHLSKVIWDRKIITEFTRLISSTRIGKPVLMMDIKVSKDKHISRWVDRENLSYIRWNRIKNVHNDEEVDL